MEGVDQRLWSAELKPRVVSRERIRYIAEGGEGVPSGDRNSKEPWQAE